MLRAEDEPSYFLIRANEEAERADLAEDWRAAAAHRELSMRYSVLAFRLHVSEVDVITIEESSNAGLR